MRAIAMERWKRLKHTEFLLGSGPMKDQDDIKIKWILIEQVVIM
jgi:hypothetical protein